MRLLRRTETALVFQLGKKEAPLLLEVLSRYPVLSTGYQPLSKHAPREEAKQRADQQMLEEALAVQKAENRLRLAKFLGLPERFKPNAAGCKFTLELSEVEWFLQILNDLRVGSWYAAGAPEDLDANKLEISEKTLPHLWAMDVSGFFQANILEALE
ncbi:MAG: hypothetical protein WCO56_10345 [Verrucomicrobiota bacterium]